MGVPQPLPADFPQVMLTESTRELCVRYRAARRTVLRWITETGTERPHLVGGTGRRLRPADLTPEIAAASGMDALMKQFGVGRMLMRRWLKEIGANKTGRGPAIGGRPAAPRARASRPVANMPVVKGDPTHAGMAAQYLREFGPVYRCNAGGRPEQYGDYWRRGNAILTPDELIARAEQVRARRNPATINGASCHG